MKKFTLFALALVFLASCGSDDDEKGKGIQEIWLNSYTAFTPQSDYEQTSAEFYFFQLITVRNLLLKAKDSTAQFRSINHLKMKLLIY